MKLAARQQPRRLLKALLAVQRTQPGLPIRMPVFNNRQWLCCCCDQCNSPAARLRLIKAYAHFSLLGRLKESRLTTTLLDRYSTYSEFLVGMVH